MPRPESRSKPLADQFAELVTDLVPEGFVWPPSLRAKFDYLYRELSRIDEERLKE